MSPSRSLPERIRLRRVELDLSARRAAKLARVARPTWLAWEAGTEPVSASRGKIERTLGWQPGSVDSILAGGEPLLPPPDYRDPETGETYQDPVERGLWNLRHAMAEPYVVTHGPERARELGEADAREHIDGHRKNQARLRRMTDPPNPRPSQVA